MVSVVCTTSYFAIIPNKKRGARPVFYWHLFGEKLITTLRHASFGLVSGVSHSVEPTPDVRMLSVGRPAWTNALPTALARFCDSGIFILSVPDLSV